MKATSQKLKDALKLIASDNNWVKENNCKVDDTTGAASYCMLGALNEANPVYFLKDDNATKELIYLTAAIQSLFGYTYSDFVDEEDIETNEEGWTVPSMFIAGFNDTGMTTHEDVIKTYNQAIKMAEENND